MAVTDEEALPAGTSSNYDRMKELKAFDESKAGVKGLVDAGVEKIPRFFIRPPDEEHLEESDSDPTHLQIPAIDLTGVENSRIRRGEIVEAIKQATATWGFFQVVNHGVPTSVLEEMIEGTRRFNEEDDELKREYYTRDNGKKVLFQSNFDLYQSPAANWRDTLFCAMAPDPVSPHELPPACRFNEFGVDGGPAAKNLRPKFELFTNHMTSYLGVRVPETEIKHLAAAAIALKGIGGILFIFGSSFGAYLLLMYLGVATPILYDLYNYDEFSAFWGITLSHGDEELNPKEATQEKGTQNEDGLRDWEGLLKAALCIS